MNLYQVLGKKKKETVFLVMLIAVSASVNIYVGYKLTLLYDIIASANIRTAVSYSTYLILLWIFSSIVTYFQQRYRAYVLKVFNNEVKGRMIRCISKMDYTVYSEKEPGEYASWLTNDIHQMEEKCFDAFFGVCESVCIILCSVVALGSMHPLILTACVGSTAILYFVPRFFQKSIEKSTMKISRMNEKFSQKIYDTLSGMAVFISENARGNFVYGNEKLSMELEEEKERLTNRIAKMGMYSTSVFRVLENLITCFSAVLAFLHMVSAGIVFSVSCISNRFLNGINCFFAYLVILRSSASLFQKYPEESVEDDREDCPKIQKAITLEALGITYGEKQILQDQNYCFVSGKKYAITGESGCGKSSLVKAVVGLHEQYSGNILFDGVNKEVCNKDSIFRQIAYIGQDVYIFNDTIRFNLTLGRTVDADEMINVLKKVNLDVLNGQEKQLDTILGDNGKNISGGQKQRIAIARSLLQQKKIFIVDEGTSALDEKNAEMIEKLLLGNPEYTVLFITHHVRKSTEKYFDQIIQL